VKPRAAIDLGWRLFGDGSKSDFLRVGMLADSEDRMLELRLPLWLRPHRIQEQRGLGTLAEMQSQASEPVKRAIALLGQNQQLPAKIGRRGLGRIAQTLDPSPLRDELEALLDDHDRIYTSMSALAFRLKQRRRWYYQCLAHWLCARYGSITLEGLNLPNLYRRSRNPALRNAAKYRNYAAVGELRATLKRVAPASICVITECPVLDTTVTCHECGEKCESSDELMVTCPNGHEWDQDRNAARNLLAQSDGTFGKVHPIPTSKRRRWKALEIAEHLKPVVVEIAAM
jgi:hypothetical protein